MTSVERVLQELSRRIALNLPVREHSARAWVPSSVRRARVRRTLANRFKKHDTDLQLDRVFTAAAALCSFDAPQTCESPGAYYHLTVFVDARRSSAKRRRV